MPCPKLNAIMFYAWPFLFLPLFLLCSVSSPLFWLIFHASYIFHINLFFILVHLSRLISIKILSCHVLHPHIFVAMRFSFSRAKDFYVWLALLILRGFLGGGVEEGEVVKGVREGGTPKTKTHQVQAQIPLGRGNMVLLWLSLFLLYQWCNDQIWVIFCSKKISEVILTTQSNMVFNFQHSVKSALEVIHKEFLIGNILLLSLYHGQNLECHIRKLFVLLSLLVVLFIWHLISAGMKMTPLLVIGYIAK